MNPKKNAGKALAAAALAAISMGIAIRYSGAPAKAAPVKPVIPAPDAAPAVTPAPAIAPTGRARVGDLLDGKLYPLTLKSEQIDSTYHLITLIDLLDKVGIYVTKGDTTVFGGETYLIAYNYPMTSGLSHPPQPKQDSVGQLILIDMHAIQAMTAISPITIATDSDQTQPEKPAK